MDNGGAPLTRRAIDKRQITITTAVAVSAMLGMWSVAWQASARNSKINDLDNRLTAVESTATDVKQTQIKICADLAYIKAALNRMERMQQRRTTGGQYNEDR